MLKQINEASKQIYNIMKHIDQSKHQHYQRELRHDEHNHDDFLYDDASPLAIELQATSWPPLYKSPQWPMYDDLSYLK